jgi:hypothetical protein
MTETELPARFLLTAPPGKVAELLPALGRVMVGLSRDGATLERIGPVGQAATAEGRLAIAGPAHESCLDLAPLARVVVDRSGGMRGKIYPRLEFQAEDGTVLMSITGMEGLEPFDAALRGWVGEAVEPRPKPAPAADAPAPAEPAAADAGGAALEALRASGGEVEIRLGTGLASQSWRGHIEEVKPVMGFANIIRPDFHLHLRQGSVAGFRATPEGWAALDAEGVPSGLLLRPLDAVAQAALAGLG